jgi:hypothetical protein
VYVLAFDLRTRQASQALTRVAFCLSADSLRTPPAGAGRSERSGGGLRAAPCSIPYKTVTSAALVQRVQLLGSGLYRPLHDPGKTTYKKVQQKEERESGIWEVEEGSKGNFVSRFRGATSAL